MKYTKREMVDGKEVWTTVDLPPQYGPPTKERMEAMERFRARMQAIIDELERSNEETAERLATISDFTMLCGALAKLPKGISDSVIRRLIADPNLPLHLRAGEIEKGIHDYLHAPRRPWWWPF